VRSEETDLLIRARAGDRAAAVTFVEQSAPAVRRLARAIVKTDAAADDVVQETFARAWQAIDSFDPTRGAARTWLYAIARHASFQLLRQRREEAVGDASDVESWMTLGLTAGWGASPEQALLLAVRREDLARALASLPAADREVLVLRDLDGLSGEDAAAMLGIEVRAMKSRLHRARLRLLGAMKAMEEGALVEENTMTCPKVLAMLSDYLDDELGPTDRVRVEHHVRECTACERFGERFAGVVHALRAHLSAPPAIADSVLDRLRAKLSE
jgi:RNA polymerase sigma-70 factor (ECF subfamily)